MIYRYYKGFKQQKLTFRLTQGHWQSCHSIGHTWLPICPIVIMSILHYFRDIVAYFPKFKHVTWPCNGQFVFPVLNHHIANQCTKFEVTSFSNYGDILGGTMNLNGSLNHSHAPFLRYGWGVRNLKWVTWRNHAPVCPRWAGTCNDQPVYRIWNLYVHPLQRYERWWKMQKFGGLGGHPRSSAT